MIDPLVEELAGCQQRGSEGPEGVEQMLDGGAMRDVETTLRTICADHGGFLRREAIELGVDDRDLRRATRRGVLHKVRHGVYAFADDWAALDDIGQHTLLVRAAMRTLDERVAVSHHSACALHGMDLWDVPLQLAHVTRLDGGAGRCERDVQHHEGLILAGDVQQLGGIAVTRPARSALESAALSGVERGLVTLSSGLRQRLFDPTELQAQQQLMQSWPGSQHLQIATRLADGRLASVGEARAWFLFWSHQLPMPQPQFEVRDGGRLVGVVDFAWPEHGLLVEFDGRVKYERFLRPGETPGDAVFREKRREDELRRLTGWRVIRLTWADLADPARTAAIIRAALRAAA